MEPVVVIAILMALCLFVGRRGSSLPPDCYDDEFEHDASL